VASPGDVSLYDITGDSLQLISSFPSNQFGKKTVTLLADGRALIAGGNFGPSEEATDEALLYDARSGTLKSSGHLLFARGDHTATLLPNGHVLVVGGHDRNHYFPEAEEYDPSTGSFSYAGSSNRFGSGKPATLLPDGTVLINDGTVTSIAELYIPYSVLRAASAATLSGPVALESLASLFGSNLALTTESADPRSPPTSLGGISLILVDSTDWEWLAPLFYVSPSQINFEVPAGIAPGNVSLEVVNAPTPVSKTVVEVDAISPGLFAYADNAAIAYALRLEPDGRQTVLSTRTTIVLDDRPAYLIAYATGIRNRSSLANVGATIGGISVPVEYAGSEGSGVPGLDQVNVLLTSALKGRGFANLVLTVDGVRSNGVAVDVR
jgi:uncharacterized protein (TIGR03437 family)